MSNLQGKNAIVTGSTSGIGHAIAEALAEAGANVMLNGFGKPDEIEAIRVGLESKTGVKVAYNGADMTKPAEIAAMADAARAAFGAVDIIVNNAGIQHVAPIEDFPIEKWDAIIAINLSSAFHLTRATFAAMKARKWGRIVNIASAHGLVASPFKSAYVAAKHGIVGLTKTVSLEGAEFGVTCNAICPGYVLTPLVEHQIPDQAKTHGITEAEVIRDIILAAQPTKQFVTTDQVRALALFLCSQEAAQITGASLSVDGGWTAQ
jgi:3-hydroxybutyrate dehydrogenase